VVDDARLWRQLCFVGACRLYTNTARAPQFQAESRGGLLMCGMRCVIGWAGCLINMVGAATVNKFSAQLEEGQLRLPGVEPICLPMISFPPAGASRRIKDII
jgi:hypothetical protein